MMARKLNNKKGSILVMAVVLSLVASFMGVSFLTFAVILHNRINQEISTQQAEYEHSAGIVQGILGRIGGHFDGLRSVSELAYGPSVSLGMKSSGHSSNQSDEPKKFMVGERHAESFADFLYLSNEERDPVRHEIIYFWVAEPDTINGKMHTNDEFHFPISIDCPAIFLDRVTQSQPFRSFPHPNQPPYQGCFMEGYGIRRPIVFPDQAVVLRENAGYTWRTMGHDSLTQLVLSQDRIYYRKCGKVVVDGVVKIHCTPSYLGDQYINIPPSGAVFVYGKAWVSASRGRVDMMDGEYPQDSYTDGNFISDGFSGQLTIGSEDTMLITDNLIYQHSRPDFSVPSSLDSCEDVLGLVSENWIMIGRLVRDSIYINAAMAAIRGAISVEDIYWAQAPGWDNEKLGLYVWGSLAQRNRGIMHTHEPAYHLRGFIERKYYYDERFSSNRPPLFPLTGSKEPMYFLEMPVSGN
jgi:hypothetical protein